MFACGDIVCLKSDQDKQLYRFEKEKDNYGIIIGVYIRIIKQVSLNEIIKSDLNEEEVAKEFARKTLSLINNQRYRLKKAIFGTVLHIDGDKNYLNNCEKLYHDMHVYAWCVYLNEKQIKDKIELLIERTSPDIVVITGHDNFKGGDYSDLTQYENTIEFMKSVKKIRKTHSKEAIIVIAGACGSNFEALIASGANFAFSPKRKNIHTFDPCIIAIICATTSLNQTIDFKNVVKLIENGSNAFGGIETKGKMRLLL